MAGIIQRIQSDLPAFISFITHVQCEFALRSPEYETWGASNVRSAVFMRPFCAKMILLSSEREGPGWPIMRGVSPVEIGSGNHKVYSRLYREVIAMLSWRKIYSDWSDN